MIIANIAKIANILGQLRQTADFPNHRSIELPRAL